MTKVVSSSAAPTVIVIVAFAHYTLVAKKELTATIAFVSDLGMAHDEVADGSSDFHCRFQ